MQYFYSWGLLFVLPFTIFCYVKSKKRVIMKMIISGIGFGIISIILSYLFLDYWTPKYLISNIHLEDFFYGFLFAGILPSIHNLIKKNSMVGKIKLDIKLVIIYILTLTVIFFTIINILHLNSIYAFSVTPLIIGIISFIKVKGKIMDLLYTVAASLFITALVYNIILFIYPAAIDLHFMLNNVSGLKFIRVPLEEWLFAFCLGVGCTYTYEALFNLN